MAKKRFSPEQVVVNCLQFRSSVRESTTDLNGSF